MKEVTREKDNSQMVVTGNEPMGNAEEVGRQRARARSRRKPGSDNKRGSCHRGWAGGRKQEVERKRKENNLIWWNDSQTDSCDKRWAEKREGKRKRKKQKTNGRKDTREQRQPVKRHKRWAECSIRSISKEVKKRMVRSSKKTDSNNNQKGAIKDEPREETRKRVTEAKTREIPIV